VIEVLDEALLKRLPLPAPQGGDKDERGRVLAIAGSSEVPGAAILTGVAALRAGAGKLQVACEGGLVTALGVAIPEARVFAIRQARVIEALGRCDAAVIGPGLIDETAASDLARTIAAAPGAQPLVIDAAALCELGTVARPLVLTPHAGEMAKLAGAEKDEVEADPAAFALKTARKLGAVVALKGAVTHLAAQDGRILRHDGGSIGLATSGSGDVLAGIVAGLLARGAEPLAAAAWAVVVHARAGAALSARIGAVGLLARELLDEIPGTLRRLGGQ
jgi:hydroxyethylthiazole kinase-like uncharacterized protein yjeF